MDRNIERKNDPAVQQIIDRVLAQHFGGVSGNGQPRAKTIDEIQTEMMAMIQQKAKIVDFAKGETCEFK